MIVPFQILSCLAGIAQASFPIAPTGLQVIDSALNSDVKISYKHVRSRRFHFRVLPKVIMQHNLCETTLGVKSFSGYYASQIVPWTTSPLTLISTPSSFILKPARTPRVPHLSSTSQEDLAKPHPIQHLVVKEGRVMSI